MVGGTIVEQGRRGEVRERWVVVVWAVAEEGAQASMWRDCHKALWLSVLSGKMLELEAS